MYKLFFAVKYSRGSPGMDVQASYDTMNDTQQSAVSFASGLEDTMSPRDKDREQLLMSMSSAGGESMQEIWRILEEQRPTPTPRLMIPG